MQNQSVIRKTSGNLLRMLIATGLLLGLGILSLLIDTDITRMRHSSYISGDVRRMIQMSEIFGHGFGTAIVLSLLWLLAPDKRRLIPRLASCAILPGLLALGIKLVVLRHRPGFYFPRFTDQISDTWIGLANSTRLNHEYVTQSFPSAHAATAIGLAIGLSWLYPKGRVAFFVLAFMASFQRVFAGAHWTSDVFFGAAVGVVVCSFIIRNQRINRLFAIMEGNLNSAGPIAHCVSKQNLKNRVDSISKAA